MSTRTNDGPSEPPASVDRRPVADGSPPAPPRGVKTMAIARWVLVVLAAIIATGSILHFAGVGFGDARSTPSGQLYHCPMHPSVVQDHPGECPICSMTLVPKPEGKAKSAAAMKPATGTPAPPAAGVPGLAEVDLTPERIQLIGMRTAKVKREALGGELRTTGVVEPNERGLAEVTTRFAGWIQTLSVAATGERVRRGQVLATVYSPDVLRAQQELLVARGWMGTGSAEARPSHGHDDFTAGLDANARRRLELLGISSQEID